MKAIDPIPLSAIEAAAVRIAGAAIRTPLVRLEDGPEGTEVYLKLECLQPIGSFKIRGASNAMAIAGAARLANGVCTASAGNMAQGVAWNARRLGIPCHVVVPDHAPEAKLAALSRLGATVVKLPFADWWEVLCGTREPGVPGLFVHPVCDPAVIAGNGTIGLEILEELPGVDAVLVPYGGGGLSCGIACALRHRRPEARVFACEVATAAPLAASWVAGAPQVVAYAPSFVDGIGGRSILDPMWALAREVLAGSLVVDLEQVAGAIRRLAARSHVVAEGAGAASVAAALAGLAPRGKVVCVVSGGNIDAAKLGAILAGSVPV
ncbi:MAG: pyridoxal-phosphate dependent enzyme [Acidobacteriota bacterium]